MAKGISSPAADQRSAGGFHARYRGHRRGDPGGLAERLKLEKGFGVTLSTANGLSEGYRTRIDRLQLGDIVLRDVRALVAPGLHGDSAARHERPEQT
jgi:hypothetical protein